MTRFNLSDWALNHRSFVWFLMIISMAAGALAYVSIGREEDPDFAIKTMIVSAAAQLDTRKSAFTPYSGALSRDRRSPAGSETRR